jgi:DNA-binding transcriptional MocR family regulator
VLVSPSTLNGVDDRAVGGVRVAFASVSSDRIVEGAKRLGRAMRALLDRPGFNQDAPPVGFV